MVDAAKCAVMRVICDFLEMNQTETGIKVPEVLELDIPEKYYQEILLLLQPEKYYQEIFLLPQLQLMKQQPQGQKGKSKDQYAAFYANYDTEKNYQRMKPLGVFQSQAVIAEKAAKTAEGADQGISGSQYKNGLAEVRASAAESPLKQMLNNSIITAKAMSMMDTTVREVVRYGTGSAA